MLGKRGRPSVARFEPTAQVTARVPASMFDQACAVASRKRESLSDLVRRAIQREVETENRQNRPMA